MTDERKADNYTAKLCGFNNYLQWTRLGSIIEIRRYF